jgi:hypothetical protein
MLIGEAAAPISSIGQVRTLDSQGYDFNTVFTTLLVLINFQVILVSGRCRIVGCSYRCKDVLESPAESIGLFMFCYSFPSSLSNSVTLDYWMPTTSTRRPFIRKRLCDYLITV